MRVTVCQLPDPLLEFEDAWGRLAVHSEGCGLVVLPELPFYPWVAWTNQYEADVWDEAVAAHQKWMSRLNELGARAVVGSAAVGARGADRRNRAFVWDEGELTMSHEKYYLPEEPGFWEASWYERGEGTFEATRAAGHDVGFLLCTEMWFTDRAREYARQGIRLLFTPRVTEGRTADKWIAGGRSAAVMSGAFSLSSNRVGSNNGVDFGGVGWVIDPDGEILATTSLEEPFVTVEIDPVAADDAKSTYPRYVPE